MNSKKTLAWLAAAIAALALALGLAACGSDDGVGGGADGDVPVAEGGEATGDVLISNWPGYIDPGADGTVAKFEDETGVEVEYKEDVSDNVVFFNKLKPQLDQGSSGGRSLFVVTDWMAKRMYDLGYLQELNHDDLPTVFDNILPQFEESTGRSRAEVLDSVAGGSDRDLGRHEPGPRDRRGQRPVRPEVQGQGDDADRDARHGPARPPERGDRS